MENVKIIFGLVLLAMALFFAKSAFPLLGKMLLPLPVGLFVGIVLIVMLYRWEGCVILTWRSQGPSVF